MKSLYKPVLLPLILSVISILFSSQSFAGFQGTYPATIGANFFYGNFGTTRNSADAIQWLYVADFGSTISIFIRDAASTSASCTTNDPNHLAALRGVTSPSYIYASYDDSGSCNLVYVYNGSIFEPPM